MKRFTTFICMLFIIMMSTFSIAAPSTPTGLTATSITNSSAFINWNSVTGTRISYNIYQNGTLIFNGASTSVSMSGLTTGLAYAIGVQAKDYTGSLSAISASITITASSTPSGNQQHVVVDNPGSFPGGSSSVLPTGASTSNNQLSEITSLQQLTTTSSTLATSNNQSSQITSLQLLTTTAATLATLANQLSQITSLQQLTTTVAGTLNVKQVSGGAYIGSTLTAIGTTAMSTNDTTHGIFVTFTTGSGTNILQNGSILSTSNPLYELIVDGSGNSLYMKAQNAAFDSSTLALPVRNNEVAINGVAVSAGNGTTDTGTKRFTLSSDSTGQVKLATGTSSIGSITSAGNVSLSAGTQTVGNVGVTSVVQTNDSQVLGSAMSINNPHFISGNVSLTAGLATTILGSVSNVAGAGFNTLINNTAPSQTNPFPVTNVAGAGMNLLINNIASSLTNPLFVSPTAYTKPAPWKYTTSVTLTAQVAWALTSLSFSAGDSSTNTTYRVMFYNTGANTAFWHLNNLTATPLFSGNAISVSSTPVQIDDLSSDTSFWSRADTSTTGRLDIWRR